MSKSSSIKVKVQQFGNFLSSMVMPNIAAFIAWGLITALFIADGLWPNEQLATMVDPMIKYLLPLLIGYTGGKIIHDVRGGVVGAIATMGVIAGADIPMFLGAMIMGPIGGYVIKKFDQLVEGRIKAGFEMLVNNFSAGILGALIAIVALKGVGPAVTAFTSALVYGVDWLINAGLLPLTSIFIEPGKILFLNNAINHGILTPIGLEQIKETGYSVLLLLEANPGPGLGVLLAYTVFGRGNAKRSAPGAAVIHFLGGIHEIYFPYVLMKPQMLLSVIAGGMSGVFTLVLLGGGLRSPASPGSIFAIAAVTPAKTSVFIANFAAIIIASVVSFIVAMVILKRSKDVAEDDLDAATKKMQDMKGKKSSVSSMLTSNQGELTNDVDMIYFACDAGMGSSAMGASLLRKKVKEAGLNIKVTNKSISSLPSDAKVVITQDELTPRAMKQVPSAYHISVDNFLSSPKYDELIDDLSKEDTHTAEVEIEETVSESQQDEQLLLKENVFLHQSFQTKEEAIRFAGEALVKAGYVQPGYVDAMLDREQMTTTYMGNHVAIPHGTDEAKKEVLSSGFVILQVPEGVDFDGEKAKLIFGIAGKDGTHLDILSGIAVTCAEMENVDRMVKATTAEEIMAMISINKG